MASFPQIDWARWWHVTLASREEPPSFSRLQATLSPAFCPPCLCWGLGPDATGLCFLLSSHRAEPADHLSYSPQGHSGPRPLPVVVRAWLPSFPYLRPSGTLGESLREEAWSYSFWFYEIRAFRASMSLDRKKNLHVCFHNLWLSLVFPSIKNLATTTVGSTGPPTFPLREIWPFDFTL